MTYDEFKELLDLIDVDSLSRKFNPAPIGNDIATKAAKIRANYPEYKDVPAWDLIYLDIWHNCNTQGIMIKKSIIGEDLDE